MTGWCHCEGNTVKAELNNKVYPTSDSAHTLTHTTYTNTNILFRHGLSHFSFPRNITEMRDKQTKVTQTTSNTTCLCDGFVLRCSRLSFPIVLLSLRLNPGSQQPLGSDAPTLPASPVPILMGLSQLAAWARSKPADWCHKRHEGEGERTTRTEREEGGGSGRLSTVMFLWTTKDKATELRSRRPGPPTDGPGPEPRPRVCVCPTTPQTMLRYALHWTHSRTIVWVTRPRQSVLEWYAHTQNCTSIYINSNGSLGIPLLFECVWQSPEYVI